MRGSETARRERGEPANQRASEPGRGKVRTFRDLAAWQRGMELAQAMYSVTARMPPDERFGLTLQARRAAVSIPSNITEGHGRESRADYLRFLRVARGSLSELSTQIELAVNLGMIEEDPQLSDLIHEEGKILQALIKALEAKEANGA